VSKKKRTRPSKDLRTIWVVIEPGEDVIVTYDIKSFAFWEVEAALSRSLEKINEEESDRQLEILQQQISFTEPDDDDDI